MKKITRNTKASQKALEAAAAKQLLEAQDDQRGKRPASPRPRNMESGEPSSKQQRKEISDVNNSLIAQILEQQQQFQQMMSANMQRMEGQLNSINQQVQKTQVKTLGNEALDRVQTEGIKLFEDPDAGMSILQLRAS